MSKEKTVFVSGNFDVLHPGHLRLLRFARECGEKLIVGVYSDRISGKTSHVPEELRLEGVKSNSWVNKVILIDDLITDVIDELRPDVVVKGKEHQKKFNPKEKILSHMEQNFCLVLEKLLSLHWIYCIKNFLNQH